MDGSTAGLHANLVKATKPRRVEFLAAARGAALFYIVLDHAVAAVSDQTATTPMWDGFLKGYVAFDHATGDTRLAVLVFMTGLFLERSLAKGHVTFITGRVRSLLWPLLLWGVVQAAIFAFTPWTRPPTDEGARIGLGLMQAGFTTLDPVLVLRGWWRVSGQLWFLEMLTVFIALFLVLRRLPSWLVLASAVVVFGASVTLTRPTGTPWLTVLFQLGPHFLYFWLGVMTTDWVIRREARITPLQALLCGALYLAIAIPPVVLGRSDWQAFAYVAGLPALPLLLNGAKWLLRTPLRPLFLRGGQASLLILCLHMLALTLILTLALAVGVTSPVLLLALSLFGGIALCFLVDRALRRLGWSAALGFGGERPVPLASPAALGLKSPLPAPPM